MDRSIDFSRNRHMLCEQCNHRWVADVGWIARWRDSDEGCPACGVTCEAESGPTIAVAPDDLALRDESVVDYVWYHTSPHHDWPVRDFDPAAALSEDIRAAMEWQGGGLAKWVTAQRARALHVGTYEAAVENMLRRFISHENEPGDRFYLYRVRLVPTVAVRPGWLSDPANFIGDVVLDEVCPPGVDVARYLNKREDPGGISLALGRVAIASVQSIEIPLLPDDDPVWVKAAAGELESMAMKQAIPAGVGVKIRAAASLRSEKARVLMAPLAERLPMNVRRGFACATRYDEGLGPKDWARHSWGLMNMFLAPQDVLAALDIAIVRPL
ncbi:hypothetical protein HQO38_18810 [Rhodococcus fascians]|nr:hypothetical protein [Rhodococcus fascians]MBY4140518.1 hypothetical protein [Rhodococcus fascians]MBY4219014.1 hypothetical protein [Rhodococcus fascians]MBY4221966.1 hypothetical protein [Rhodococcus fascians]MBY4233967.1 hypothetical protein [Rhodococcus fascians]